MDRWGLRIMFKKRRERSSSQDSLQLGNCKYTNTYIYRSICVYIVMVIFKYLELCIKKQKIIFKTRRIISYFL